jgi:uncharacterized HAD superfamily protein
MEGTIVLDIDGVLADTTRAAYVAATNGRLDSIGKYDLLLQDKLVAARMYELFLSTPFNLLAPVVQDALEMVRELKADGARLIALTARPDCVTEATSAWMRQWFPEIEQIVFTEKGHMKSDYINEYQNVIAFVDDNAMNLNDVMENTDVPIVIAPRIYCQDYTINELTEENKNLIVKANRYLIGLEDHRLMYVRPSEIAAVIKLAYTASLLK